MGKNSEYERGRNMVKEEKIKLKVAERKEADNLHREIAIAEQGIMVAHRIRFEAGERLWEYLRMLHPGMPEEVSYNQGILTYRGDKPCK